MLKCTTISGPKCPSCGDRKMVTDETTGELFCGKCGFVVSDKISDTGAEWRSFANDDTNRARTGAGTSLAMHDMGLSTIIGAPNKDSTGKPLTSSMKNSIERLRTLHNMTKEKQILLHLNIINDVTDYIDLDYCDC